MKVAVISDIHGNLMALEAVLDDIDEKNVDELICLGDLVGYLPFANEVVELLREEDMFFVLGNHDQKVIHSDKLSKSEFMQLSKEDLMAGGSANYMHYILTPENREFLEWCPEQVTMKLEGVKVLCVHGSPDSISEYLYEETEKLKELSKGLEEDILLCGHTHLPYHVQVNGKHFINPGSVGRPKDGDNRASYMLIDIEGDQVTSRVVKVAYDIEMLVEGIKEDHYINDALIENIRLAK